MSSLLLSRLFCTSLRGSIPALSQKSLLSLMEHPVEALIPTGNRQGATGIQVGTGEGGP